MGSVANKHRSDWKMLHIDTAIAQYVTIIPPQFDLRQIVRLLLRRSTRDVTQYSLILYNSGHPLCPSTSSFIFLFKGAVN